MSKTPMIKPIQVYMMPKSKTSQLDIEITKLDVLCTVVDTAVLQPAGRRPTKADVKVLHDAAQKVVTEYLKEVNKNG